MNNLIQSSPDLSGLEMDESSLEDYDDAFLDIGDSKQSPSPSQIIDKNFNTSTPCLAGSRPASSISNNAEWTAEVLTGSMANSDSCLVSSSSNTSPLTGTTSSQGLSPIEASNKLFSFQSDIKGTELSLTSINEALQTEKDFMDYVMSFPIVTQNTVQRSQSETRKNPSENSPKIGLDHLDNLCKLMEQLSDLKEANFKLKRRVQYLEDLKTLHEIHREMLGVTTQCHSGVASGDEDQRKSFQSITHKRRRSDDTSPEMLQADESRDFNTGLYRSKTTTNVEVRLDEKKEYSARSRNGEMAAKGKVRERSKSVGHPGHSKPKKRPSRWSKVKEVLGIEKGEGASDQKAPPYEGGINEGDFVKRGMMECYVGNTEMTSENHSATKSSMRQHCNPLTSSSCSQIPYSTVDTKEGSKKFSKTPWSRMKTMITIRRDCRNQGQQQQQQKSESSSSSSRGIPAIENPADFTAMAATSQQSCRRSSRSSRKSTFVLQDVPKKFQHEGTKKLSTEDSGVAKSFSSPKECYYRQKKLSLEQETIKKTNMYDPLMHPNQKTDTFAQDGQIRDDDDASECELYMQTENELRCAPSTSIKQITKREKIKPRPFSIHGETRMETDLPSAEKGEADHPSSSVYSPRTQRRKIWEAVKDVLKEKEDAVKDTPADDPSLPPSNDGMEAQKPCPHPCASATVTELLKELQQNLSEDFNRKLEEWHKYRGDGVNKTASPAVVERKDSFGRFRKSSKPEKKISAGEKMTKSNVSIQKKDINWLDKELQKVEREILRLSKEKQKFEKRAFRLKRLKEAASVTADKKSEVLVKTSAGEFRFEGISDAFTKKLYEWETKKGVGPEFSTIALLDESLKPQNGKDIVSREQQRTIPNFDQIHNPEPYEKFCYQKSKCNSEPDLSTLSSVSHKGTITQIHNMRSKSGDTLLATSNESGICPSDPVDGLLEMSANQLSRSKPEDMLQTREDNYCSLLEENMFLLDQLKGKEEICCRLQGELDRLDERTEKANKNHEEELEKYRQKLWEIHMSRPRDLQGSLQLISELKARIEELQKCSDRLKMDRERLEENFRYHSEQQRRLTDGVIQRMMELQETGLAAVFNRSGCRKKWRRQLKCDAGSVARVHQLSTRLLQQAREMEEALGERTRQVCHLRWELLHRDMSAVLLQAALHRVTSQGPQATILPAWDMKRIKFKELKAWSFDTTTRRQSEDTTAEDWLQERLKQLSLAPYNEWTSLDFTPNDLLVTVHDLKKEAIRMSCSTPCGTTDCEERKKRTSCSAESEVADSDRNCDTGSAFNSRSSSFSSGPGGGGLRGSYSDTRLYERSQSVHRNSSSSMSCISGFDASESSSMQDSSDKHVRCRMITRGNSFRTKRKNNHRWPSRDNVSSSCSSRSSGLEDDANVTGGWKKASAKEDIQCQERCLSHHLQLVYGSFKETDEEKGDLSVNACSSQCLITPKPMHVIPLYPDEGKERTAESSSFLRAMMMHPAYGQPTNIHETSPEYKRVFEPGNLTSDGTYRHRNNDYGSKPHGRFTMPQSIDLKGTKGSFVEYVPHPEAHESQNSSRYTSAESLENFKYVTHSEQQLFSDIRKLAISCETSDIGQKIETETYKSPFQGIPRSSSAKDIFPTELPTDVVKHPAVTSTTKDITKFKYKGTKGFGRVPKLHLKNGGNSNSKETTGVGVASDRRPEHRLESSKTVTSMIDITKLL